MNQEWWKAFPEAQPAQGGIVTRGADPMLPYKTTQERFQAQAAPFDADKARSDAVRAQAEAEKARIEADRAAAERGQGRVLSDDQQKLKAKMASLDSLVHQINRVEELYGKNIAGQPASRAFGMTEFFPTPTNKQFDAAGAGLAEQGLAAFRVPGVGSQSDTELRQFVAANKPSAGDYDAAIEEKLLQLKSRVDATRAQLGLSPAEWRQQQAEDEKAAAAKGMDASTQFIGNQNLTPQPELSDDGMQTIDDPKLKAVGLQLGRMIGAGVPDAQVMAFAEKAGVSDQPEKIIQALRYRRSPEYQAWKRANPNAPYPIGPEFWQRKVPLSMSESLMNQAGQSPVGTFMMNAGDAVTLGTLDNMTSDPERARAGMAQASEKNWKSALAGKVAGGVAAAGGAELAAVTAGLKGARAAMAGDAAFGAGYGAGSTDDGNRAVGALTGAGAGIGGGIAGRAVVGGTGRVLTGTRDAGTRFLADKGIPLTVGQIAGKGGLPGRAVKKLEDALESVPILGAAISRRKAEGVEGFNKAAFREALEPIPPATVGTVAEEGVDQAKSAVAGAYKTALSGVTAKADPIFVRDMKRAVAAGGRLHSETAEDFAKIIEDQIAPAFAKGPLTGDEYQAIRQVLRQERAAWKGKPRGHQYGQALRQVEGALESLVRRRAPGTVEDLNRADAAYRGTGVVRDAVSRGKNTGGLFTPAQLGMAAEANAKKFGGQQATTQRPFYELQRNAQETLPSSIPNSGTADRLMSAALLPALPGLAGAGAAQAGLIDPQTAAYMAALGLPYTKVGQQAFQKMLVERPEAVRAVGEKLLRRKNLGGLLGAPAATAGLLSAE